MENLKNILLTEVSYLENQGSICEMQSKMVKALTKQSDFLESIVMNHTKEEIRASILEIVKGVSFKIQIPQREVLEELTSPMDTLLVSKKRQSFRSTFNLENQKILNQMDLDNNSENLCN